MANKFKQILDKSRKSWLLLIQTMAWVAAVIASFILPPPIGTADETKVWVRFAQFIITVFIGLLVLLMLRRNLKKHATVWGMSAALFLVLGTVSFFAYQILATRWTVSYSDERVLIGRTLTQQAAVYLQLSPTLTSRDLLMHYAGRVDKIWTMETVNERRFILAGVYIASMPLFTICIISLVQAIACATVERKKPRRRAQSETAAASSEV